MRQYGILSYMIKLKRRIGLDLGTCNTRIYVPGKGVVVNEPTVVAVDKVEGRIGAVGHEAKRLLGRAPENYEIICPIENGSIVNSRVTQLMIQHFLKKALGFSYFLRPDIVVSIPTNITQGDRRAVVEIVRNAGGLNVHLIEEPILAAKGAQVSISRPQGSIIVDIGGGMTDIAVMSYGGIISANSINVGGNTFDNAIVEYIKENHGLNIGKAIAEQVRMNVGSALITTDEQRTDVKGSDKDSQLPRMITVTTNDVARAIEPVLNQIIRGIESVLHTIPPELASDIIDNGVVITGGGGILKNIEDFFKEVLKLEARTAENQDLCVILGTGTYIDFIDEHRVNIKGK